MIGVSLGASSGEDFLPLFVAIVFHQVFEGLALGSRIGQLVWPQGQWMKKWVMCAMFGVSSFPRLRKPPRLTDCDFTGHHVRFLIRFFLFFRS